MRGLVLALVAALVPVVVPLATGTNPDPANVVTGRVLNGERLDRAEPLSGVMAAAIETDDKHVIDQSLTDRAGIFRLTLPAEKKLFRLWIYDRSARFRTYQEQDFTKVERNPQEIDPVTLYAAIASAAELKAQREAVRKLEIFGEKEAAERHLLALTSDFPSEFGAPPCGESVAPASLRGVTSAATPGLLRARVSANESAIIGSLRTLHSAEVTYESVFDRFGTLSNLVWPPYSTAEGGPSFLDKAFLTAGRARSGYLLRHKLDWPAAPRIASLSVFLPPAKPTFRTFACPEKPGVTGVRYFYVDESGSIGQSLKPMLDGSESAPLQ